MNSCGGKRSEARGLAEVKNTHSLPTPMLKHGASGTHKTRKQRKNGISSSSLLLDVVDTDTPLTKPQLMQVWHTNTADPTTSRQSTVPIPSESHVQVKEASTKCQGEFFNTTVPTVTTIRARPKRKRGNNSVSYDSVSP